MLPIMSTLSRTLCILWMLLALPLQGMAQASMFACHSNGAGSLAIDNRLQMDHSKMDHGMTDHAAHGESSGAQHDDQVSNASHGCCNCAPSCVVVMPAADQARFNATRPHVVLPLLFPQASFSADIRRIDRPPKTHAI